LPHKDPVRRAEYQKKYRAGIPIDYERKRGLIKARRLRVAVLAYLGNKCVRCGFDDARALQVDHILGGGRKEKADGNTYRIYRNVINGRAGYQLLCANCNWIKRYENQAVEMPGRTRNG